MKSLAVKGLSKKETYLIENAYEKIRREYDNDDADNLELLLTENEYHQDVLVKSLEKNRKFIKSSFVNKLNYVQQGLLDRIEFCRFLVVGNYDEAQSLALARSVVEVLGLGQGNHVKDYQICTKAGQIKPGEILQWDTKDDESDDDSSGSSGTESEDPEKNAAICIYFQGAEPGFKEAVILDLLELIIDESMYNELRTKQQLGYEVSCYHYYSQGVSGLAFEIESCQYNPLELEKQIMEFVEDFYRNQFTETLYSNYLKALILTKSQSLRDIKEESSDLMATFKDFFPQEGGQLGLIWRRTATEVAYLENALTFGVVKQKYEDLLISKKLRRMAVLRNFPVGQHDLAKHTSMEKKYSKLSQQSPNKQSLVYNSHIKM